MPHLVLQSVQYNHHRKLILKLTAHSYEGVQLQVVLTAPEGQLFNLPSVYSLLTSAIFTSLTDRSSKVLTYVIGQCQFINRFYDHRH